MNLDDIHKIKKETARIKEENDILKKCIAIFSDKKKDQRKQLLYVAKLSKSSCFNYLKRASRLSKTQENIAVRRQAIKTIFYEFRKIYGARKIKIELEKQQIYVSVRTVGECFKFCVN